MKYKKGILLASALLSCTLTAQASPLGDAIKASKNKQYIRSNQILQKIGQNDAKKYLLHGYNYLALKQYQWAISKFQQVQKLGFKKPILHLLVTQAYIGLKQYSAAISACHRYVTLSNKPSLGYEMLGKLYAIKGNIEKSDYYLDLAEKDSTRKTNIQRYRKGLALVRARQLEEGGTKPWSVTASIGGGYDSNALALGDNFRLPSNTSSKSSTFAETMVFGHYLLKDTGTDSFKLLYQFLGNFYKTDSDLNYLNPYLALNWSHKVNQQFTVGFNGSIDNAWLGGSDFSRIWSATSSIGFDINNWNSTEINYTYQDQTYHSSPAPVFDRSGFNHFVSIEDFIKLNEYNLTLRLGYAKSWNNAQGADQVYKADHLFIGLNKQLPFDITLAALYTYVRYDYSNQNSLSRFGAAEKRRDNTNRYMVHLQKPFINNIMLYGRYENFNDNSNIPFYAYKQYLATIGLTFNWS